MNRRKLLKFLGLSSLAVQSILFQSACSVVTKKNNENTVGLLPTQSDDVELAVGLSYYRLISWKEKISISKDLYYGYNNDYIALLGGSDRETHMWVNHESVNPMYVSGYFSQHGRDKTKEQVDIERKNVGGSYFKIKKVEKKWTVDHSSEENNRLDGFSKIPFSPPQKIANSSFAIGTFSNCAGGVTPWGTVLSCEENFHDLVGDVKKTRDGVKKVSRIQKKLSWESQTNFDPRHYGWVVEYDPASKSAKKLVSLGRFSHECATCVLASDGRTVVYMGDDKSDQCIYKFIANKSGSLESGTLYVADTVNGKWKPLSYSLGEPFTSNFKNQQELLVFTREAARLVGATPLDRPEDIEVSPVTGDVYVALTNNKPKGNFHGSILKISEKNSDPLSLEFKADTFKLGGQRFSCPDNLVFDKKGNLWMTSDISGASIGKGPYTKFGNNGLFVIPISGVNAGKVVQVASAPNEAEFTGPCFSKDYKTLFLSVQHPGEKSKLLSEPHSKWSLSSSEDGPLPTVICIEGPLLENFLS